MLTAEKIHTQKYIALYGQIEAYSNCRGVDLSALTPNSSASQATIPIRLPIPLSEGLYNKNATVVGNTTTPVW